MKPVIDSLDHLALTVASIEESSRFYGAVLGMTVFTFGEGRIALGFGQQKINLHQMDTAAEPKAADPTPGSADLCFLSNTALADLQAHIENCGVAIEAGPVERSGATGPILSIYFRDPDGNLIEVANPVAEG
jgi:catechol 2,3-dioxygenase-like lactoylglutathione lyase family enzyme